MAILARIIAYSLVLVAILLLVASIVSAVAGAAAARRYPWLRARVLLNLLVMLAVLYLVLATNIR